jgi:putative component of membrane protein insertase Oxa1/YidC/SpoIIIJ protein YidD
MKNKNVGFLIIGIAVVMAIIVLLFNNVIKDNLGLTCSHGPSCEMYTNL